MIVQDHEKITFTNPGSLRITKEEAMSGGISDPRNTVIFKMFAMLNIGEREREVDLRICSMCGAKIK